MLLQVLPLPEGFTLATGSELPAWVVDHELCIGREVDPEREICLTDDRKASKEHARLRPRGGQVEIEDRKSTNGTFVNGRTIKKQLLDDGAVIRTGNTLFVLRFERPGSADAPKAERAVHNRLLGQSQEVRSLRHALSRAASSVGNVLLMGPTGAGKELGAATIHALSPRHDRPLVAVNCAAIQPNTAESALFGHRRGSFTGADRDHEGYFKQADTGTLFLDEVGELPLDVQAKLLRALQPGTSGKPPTPGQNILRIQLYGGQGEAKVNVRIIAATNVDLEDAVKHGRFRQDLFQRLCVLPIYFPALARRREDILPLLQNELDHSAADRKRQRISARLGELLLLYKWPGNVREIENVGKQLQTLAPSGGVIDLDLLPEALLSRLSDVEEEPERGQCDEKKPPITHELLVRLLHENDGKILRVARLLGRSTKQIRRRMEQFGITRRSSQISSAPTTAGTEADDDNAPDDEGA